MTCECKTSKVGQSALPSGVLISTVTLAATTENWSNGKDPTDRQSLVKILWPKLQRLLNPLGATKLAARTSSSNLSSKRHLSDMGLHSNLRIQNRSHPWTDSIVITKISSHPFRIETPETIKPFQSQARQRS